MSEIPVGWHALDHLPPSGEPVEGLLSDGTTTAAEYWDGPDERPDWGGWGWDMTLRFASEDWTPELELIAWRTLPEARTRPTPPDPAPKEER